MTWTRSASILLWCGAFFALSLLLGPEAAFAGLVLSIIAWCAR